VKPRRLEVATMIGNVRPQAIEPADHLRRREGRQPRQPLDDFRRLLV
jgi:hypothetical protein